MSVTYEVDRILVYVPSSSLSWGLLSGGSVPSWTGEQVCSSFTFKEMLCSSANSLTLNLNTNALARLKRSVSDNICVVGQGQLIMVWLVEVVDGVKGTPFLWFEGPITKVQEERPWTIMEANNGTIALQENSSVSSGYNDQPCTGLHLFRNVATLVEWSTGETTGCYVNGIGLTDDVAIASGQSNGTFYCYTRSMSRQDIMFRLALLSASTAHPWVYFPLRDYDRYIGVRNFGAGSIASASNYGVRTLAMGGGAVIGRLAVKQPDANDAVNDIEVFYNLGSTYAMCQNHNDPDGRCSASQTAYGRRAMKVNAPEYVFEGEASALARGVISLYADPGPTVECDAWYDALIAGSGRTDVLNATFNVQDRRDGVMQDLGNYVCISHTLSWPSFRSHLVLARKGWKVGDMASFLSGSNNRIARLEMQSTEAYNYATSAKANSDARWGNWSINYYENGNDLRCNGKRALVHSSSDDRLVVNYNNDFSGGVVLNGVKGALSGGPVVRAWRSTNQNFPNNVERTVAWDAVALDSPSEVMTFTDSDSDHPNWTSVFSPIIAGWYLILYNYTQDQDIGGYVWTKLSINNNSYAYCQHRQTGWGTNEGAYYLHLTSGTPIKLRAYSAHNEPRSIIGGEQYTYLAIYRLFKD